MRNVLAIAGREVRMNFVTPMAYVVIAGFVLIAGFFFFSLLQQFNTVLAQAAMLPDIHPNLNEWVVSPFFETLQVVLVFLLPVLTMRAIAEEKRSGTFELLSTSPLSEGQIVLGKFLGVASVVVVMLVFSFIFPLVLVIKADPEIMPVFVGFLGTMLFAVSLSAVGLAVSAFTKSQTIAGVVGMVVMLILYVLSAPGPKLGERVGAVLAYLAPSTHTEPMIKGVLDGADLVYFLSLMLLGLFIANRALNAHRWR